MSVTRILWLISLLTAFFLPTLAVASPALNADQAFAFAVEQQGNGTWVAHWRIAPGFHLYKAKIQIQPEPGSETRLETVSLPKGQPEHSPWLGDYEIYTGDVTIPLVVTATDHGLAKLAIHYQGCRGETYCYPPITKHIAVALTTVSGNHYTDLLITHNPWLLILSFFGIGFLLAFTPCVLPMLPILSGIILGQKDLSTRRAFTLTLIYVLSMSLTYAIAGVFAGYVGDTLQAKLQHPAIIFTFSFIFVALALSLFGWYEIQLPGFIRHRIHSLSAQQSSGKYLSVAVMGCLSTLIVSPCVSAPLAGTLTYISSTGNALLGGMALFIMGLGMGTPLLIVGTAEGKFLPKSGQWMHKVNVFFGIIMLGMAVWMIARIIPPVPQTQSAQLFKTIQSVEELNTELAAAKRLHKPIIVDYYADWCVACQEMEHAVFRNADVKKVLSQFVLLRADLTADSPHTHALAKKFAVYAPPSVIFVDSHSQVIAASKIEGTVNTQEFLHLATLALQTTP